MNTLELKNPPVIEAVFNISVKPLIDCGLDYLSRTNSDFIKLFPVEKPINHFESKFEFSSDKESSPSTTTKTLIGFQYESDEKKSLIQRRVNGFSYHKLRQYCGWNSFISEAMTYWKSHYSLFPAKESIEIDRLGLRFINDININGRSIDKSFNIPLAKLKIGKFTNLACTYSLDLNEYSATVSLYPLGKNNQYILDIDVFKIISASLSEKEIMSHFAIMREKKNSIFSNILKKIILKQYE